MQQLIEKIWVEERMPKEWTEAIISPLYKKGDTTNCEYYRGIALLNTAYKIMATAIKKRLVKHMDKSVGEYQSGFKKGRSVIEQIFALIEL